MPFIKTIFFDIDGTLVDSRGLIVASANHTLNSLGLIKRDEDFIIRNMKFETSYLVSKILDSSNPEKIKQGVGIFTDYWKTNIRTKTKLFPGVIETLEYIKQSGIEDLAVISNGVGIIIEDILQNFNIRKYFKNVFSGDDTDCIKPTACPIHRTFENLEIKNRDNSLMVGDMAVDIKAGKEAGIYTCGVTYGIGNRQDIINASPDFVIDSFKELRDIISI